jgi:sulfonate transport system substrate-binding protein
MTNITRRALAGVATLLAAPALAQSTPILRIGNQKGGLRSLIDISGQGAICPIASNGASFPQRLHCWRR